MHTCIASPLAATNIGSLSNFLFFFLIYSICQRALYLISYHIYVKINIYNICLTYYLLQMECIILSLHVPFFVKASASCSLDSIHWTLSTSPFSNILLIPWMCNLNHLSLSIFAECRASTRLLLSVMHLIFILAPFIMSFRTAARYIDIFAPSCSRGFAILRHRIAWTDLSALFEYNASETILGNQPICCSVDAIFIFYLLIMKNS